MRTLLILLCLSTLNCAESTPVFSALTVESLKISSVDEYQPISMVIISAVNAGNMSVLNSDMTPIELAIAEHESVAISGKALAYPNPMKWSDTNGIIGYALNQSTDVTLSLFDMRGVEIYTEEFASEEVGGREGYNKIPFNKAHVGEDLSTGVYVFLLMHDGSVLAESKVGIHQ